MHCVWVYIISIHKMNSYIKFPTLNSFSLYFTFLVLTAHVLFLLLVSSVLCYLNCRLLVSPYVCYVVTKLVFQCGSSLKLLLLEVRCCCSELTVFTAHVSLCFSELHKIALGPLATRGPQSRGKFKCFYIYAFIIT